MQPWTFLNKFTLWLTVSSALLLIGGSLFAEPMTRAELKGLLRRYQNMTSLDVDFDQVKVLTDLDLKLKSTGHLSVRVPDQVTWEVKSPAPLKVELNREQITISGDRSKSQIDTSTIPPEQKREFLYMLNWLKLDADAIAEAYTMTRKADGKVVFTATGGESLFTDLELQLTRDGHLKNLRFKEKSKDEIQISFGPPTVRYENRSTRDKK